MSDKELSVEEVLKKSSREIEIFIDSMADSLNKQDVVPEAIKTTVAKFASAKWPERDNLSFCGLSFSELLEKMAEKDKDGSFHYARLEERLFENNPQIRKIWGRDYFSEKVRQKEFEDAYFYCFGGAQPISAEIFNKEMAEAYKNPNLALKKLYEKEDYHIKVINTPFFSDQRKSYDKDQLEIEKKKESEIAYIFVETAYRKGIEIEPELADRFFDSAENRKNLYAHYEEFVADDLDKAEKALSKGDSYKKEREEIPREFCDVDEKLREDKRFKDSAILWRLALCERLQKKYDGNDCDENIKKQRFALSGLLYGLTVVDNLSETEKAKIPETVWNRLGNVFINENLNDYYEKKSHYIKGAVRDRDARRFYKHLDTYKATIKVLPDVAEYGLKRAGDSGKRLLSDTIIHAHDRLSELSSFISDFATIQEKMPKNYKYYFSGEKEDLYTRARAGVELERMDRKKHEGVARRKQEIKQRLAARKEEGKVSGVVVAEKIAEAQTSGLIYEPVTPEKGKHLSDSIKRKLLSQKQTNRF